MTTDRTKWSSGRVFIALTGVALSGFANAGDVRLATAPWPGATVKTEITSQLLQRIGYDTSVTEASTAIILQGMVGGDIDINMALWRPSQSDMLDPRLKTGELVEVAQNIQGARYRLAVPNHVWQAGVHSMADLAEHAERFEHSIYGIEPGNVGNEISQKAIDENTYGLGDWKVVASSVSGMLIQLEANTRDQRWTVFQAWEPHWMNVAYDVHYLEDPENLWGDDSSVSTIANADFLADTPNINTLLEQIVVHIEDQNAWVQDYSREQQPLEAVASDWLDANPDQVEQWLEGVTTAKGGMPARQAYRDTL